MENLKEKILGVVLDVAQENSPQLEAVRPDQMLVEDLGLRSLDLARIVAKLEMVLGVDPFAELVAVTSIRTPGDLIDAYSKCFTGEGESAEGSESESEGASAPRQRSGLASQRDLRKQSRGE
ncbi:MAG: acyl carrier protein [Pirellulales bacterium]|nr:acyl carrier protein [Pirellulales bacterium]